MHNIHAYVLLCNERNVTVCCKFTQLHSCQILLKLVNIWLSYCENKKGELFLKHSVQSTDQSQWPSGRRPRHVLQWRRTVQRQSRSRATNWGCSRRSYWRERRSIVHLKSTMTLKPVVRRHHARWSHQRSGEIVGAWRQWLLLLLLRCRRGG